MSKGDVIVRAPTHGDLRYLYATSRSIVLARNGDRFADYNVIHQMVNDVLDRCALSVAVLEGEDHGGADIHGFAVEDPRDASIEFFHMRKLYREMSSPTLGARVARALLRERESVVLRRGPAAESIKAIVAAGYNLTVRPRSI